MPLAKKWLLLTISVFCVASGFAQKNLVENGDFEDGLDGWNSNGPIINYRVVKNGKSSCAIVAYTKDQWVGLDQLILLPKNAAALEFSAWVKTERVEQGKDAWNTALMTIQFLDAGDRNVGEGVPVFNSTGTSDWQQYTRQTPVPAGAKKAKLMLALGNASGNMFVDDVRCKIVK